jgi:hypothetical protein
MKTFRILDIKLVLFRIRHHNEDVLNQTLNQKYNKAVEIFAKTTGRVPLISASYTTFYIGNV